MIMMRNLLSFTFGLMFLAGSPVIAQVPAASLAPDSAELYIEFFQFHDDFSQWMDKRKAANAQAAQTLDASAAAHFKMDLGDLGKLRGVTNSVMAVLRNIDRDVQAYLNSRTRYELITENSVMQQFAQLRAQAALDGAARLQQVLSAASWVGLHNYINNVHRLRYHPGSPAKK